MGQQRIGRIQWGDLTFGPGSPYMVTAINGLDDMPDIRAEDIARPDQHGDYTGPDTTGARIIQLGLGLRADSPDELRKLTLALRAATQPQRQPQPLRLLDQDTLVYGKVRQRNIPYDAEYLWRTGTAALELYCADPHLYSLTEHSASTTAYSPAAGRTYPLTYTGAVPGRMYGDAGQSGRLTAINDGASPAYPVLRIDGPVANPSIEQVTTGGGLVIDGTLQPGEYLVIDTRTRAVLLMGSSPRRSWVRAGSTWPLLQPGPNSLAYRGSALPGASGQPSLLTVTWRDTSL
ncbi:phage tail domain-containing protein [Streptomyces sp. NPDC001832]|uniref:phage distal tail protein n=1 Tax=Streptomyces sp. NPDC001832 TaxID=3154527 RepID=UPI003325BEFF